MYKYVLDLILCINSFNMWKTVLFLSLSSAATTGPVTHSTEPPTTPWNLPSTTNDTPKNVIMIIIDDMRPEVMSYGASGTITPNFDALGQQSTVFRKAYAQQAICGPSRSSFLSGRRPSRTKSWNLIDSFRATNQAWESLPGFFKNRGYFTTGAGKIYHSSRLPPNFDGNNSWSEELPFIDTYETQEFDCDTDEFDSDNELTEYVCPSTISYTNFPDYMNLVNMTEKLEYAVNKRNVFGQPFFLAYGIHKPHLPFHFPKSFGDTQIWDAYGPTVNISLPKREAFPLNMPPIAYSFGLDSRSEINVFGQTVMLPGMELGCPSSTCGVTLSANITQIMRKGYYSALSFADYMLGQFLAEVDKYPGLREETVIVVMGDHGFHLGEQNTWGKATNFEISTRIPLFIQAPAQTLGRTSDAIVEAIDVYPTIVSLSGLTPDTDLDGTDLSPIVLGQETTTNKLVDAAFSVFPRCSTISEAWSDQTSCTGFQRDQFVLMGLSVRTNDWRCTNWFDWDPVDLRPMVEAEPLAREFYVYVDDDAFDVDAFESENLAGGEYLDLEEICLNMTRVQWTTSALNSMERSGTSCLAQAAVYTGDGFCDQEFNKAACDWDGGDCCGPSCSNSISHTCGFNEDGIYTGFPNCLDPIVTDCMAAIDSLSYISDGYCDAQDGMYNSLMCSWDGGDCCNSTCTDDGKSYECGSTGYRCQDPDASDYLLCIGKFTDSFGDGFCDHYFFDLNSDLNIAMCDWDGGDCCASTCDSDSIEDCNSHVVFECLDPNASDYGTISNCSVTVPSWIGDGVCDEGLIMDGLQDFNTDACGWDGGDCCQSTCHDGADYACAHVGYSCRDPNAIENDDNNMNSCVVDIQSWLGDGYCDIDLELGDYNTLACDWDLGDCCFETCVTDKMYACGHEGDIYIGYPNCLDPDALNDCNTPQYSLLGDGWCDDGDMDFNTAVCNWDFGDCCLSTCISTQYTCGHGGYDCQDPSQNGFTTPEGSELECLASEPTRIGDGFCDDWPYNTHGCNWDGGDCCSDSCVSSTYLCGYDGKTEVGFENCATNKMFTTATAVKADLKDYTSTTGVLVVEADAQESRDATASASDRSNTGMITYSVILFYFWY